MATKTLQPCRAIASASGAAPEQDSFTVTGSTHVEGDLCVRTNNSIAACAYDPASISTLALTAAANTIPGSTAGSQTMVKVKSQGLFEMNAYHGTPSSATVADADIDDAKKFGVSFETVSGVSAWVIDLADTTATRVTIVKRIDDATDTYPRCQVQFHPANCTFN